MDLCLRQRARARLLIPGLLAALLGASASAVAASDWQVLQQDANRVFEIDRSSVRKQGDGMVFATGRLTYSDALAERRGFNRLVVLNVNDCAARTFSIVKRSYLDAQGGPADVEAVQTHARMRSSNGSIDDYVLTAACELIAQHPEGVASAKAAAPEAAQVTRVADEPADPQKSIAPKLVERPTIDPKMVERPRAAATAAQPAAAADPRGATKADAAKPEAARADAAKTKADGAKPAADSVDAIAERVIEKLNQVRALNAQGKAVSSVTVRTNNRTAPASHTRAHAASGSAPSAKAEQAVHAAAAEHAHWDYEGANGPSQWGRLDPAWGSCERGTRQSPIDIQNGIKVALEPIDFDYHPSHWTIVDNGHTVQVNFAPGNAIRVAGRQYDLVQMHFHRPSEEHVAGKAYDMVAHLVHRSADGKLAVVAVLIEPGAANALVDTLWAHLPLERNDTMSPMVSIDPAQMLPEAREYWTYMGSLTTPPCTEGVLWLVMKTPKPWSGDQIGVFARLYPMNARPVQAADGRLIKESR